MKKEVYIPKYKAGDYLISGDVVLYILEVADYKDGYYYYHTVKPYDVRMTHISCEQVDKHMLTTKGNAAIIKMLYE